MKQVLVFIATDKDGYADAMFAADNLITLNKMVDEWKSDADMSEWREWRVKIIEYREESGVE